MAKVEVDQEGAWDELLRNGAMLDTYILTGPQLLLVCDAVDQGRSTPAEEMIVTGALALMHTMRRERKICALCLPYHGHRFKLTEGPAGVLFALPTEEGRRPGLIAPVCRACMQLTPAERHERFQTVLTTFGLDAKVTSLGVRKLPL